MDGLLSSSPRRITIAILRITQVEVVDNPNPLCGNGKSKFSKLYCGQYASASSSWGCFSRDHQSRMDGRTNERILRLWTSAIQNLRAEVNFEAAVKILLGVNTDSTGWWWGWCVVWLWKRLPTSHKRRVNSFWLGMWRYPSSHIHSDPFTILAACPARQPRGCP